MRILSVTLVLALGLAAPRLWAGGVISYSIGTPTAAEIGADLEYVLPGEAVNLWPSDGRGGPAYDRDSKRVDGNFIADVEDAISSATWSASAGSLTRTSGMSTAWTAPQAEGTYTLGMSVIDSGAWGSGSLDGWKTRYRSIFVTYLLPPRHVTAKPTGPNAIALGWQTWRKPGSWNPGGYAIYRWDPGTTTFVWKHTEPYGAGGPYTWTDTSVATGLNYTYYIRVVDGSGQERPYLQSPQVRATAEPDQPSNILYIANSRGNNVLVVDAATKQIYATIPLGKTSAAPGAVGPLGIVVSPDGLHAFVSNYGPNLSEVQNASDYESSVSVLQSTNNAEADTDDNPQTTNPSTAPDGMSRLTFSSGEADRIFRVEGMAVSPDGRYVYVANYGGRKRPVDRNVPNDANLGGRNWPGSIEVIDTRPANGLYSAYRLVDGLAHPNKVAVSPDGAYLYVTMGADYDYTDPDTGTPEHVDGNAVRIIDLSFGTTIDVPLTTSTMPAPRPQGITLATTGGTTYAWVVNSLGQSVTVLDAATGAVVNPRIALGPYGGYPVYPMEVAASPDGQFVFVVGSGAYQTGSRSLLWVIDPSNGTVLSQTALSAGQVLNGAGRIGVVQDMSSGTANYRLYITHYNSDKASVVTVDAAGVVMPATSTDLIDTGTNSGPGGVVAWPSVVTSSSSFELTANTVSILVDQYPAVQLTWQDIYNNEVGFKIERSVDGGAKWTHVWSAPPDITTWTDHGVGGSRRYYYRIQAYTNTGPGAYSNIASATTHSGSGIDFRNSPWEFPLDPSDARAQDRPEFLNGAPVPEIEGPPAPGVDYYPQIPWNSSVTYEAETGRMIVEPAQVGGSSFIDQITYGTSTIYDEDNASGSGASNDDGRQNAGDTTKPPWAAVCRLVVRTWGPVVGGLQFPDAEPGYASGVLISPRHLLTAAHVIIANPLASDPAARSSAFTIVAQPGRNGSINMYGSLSWKRYSILGNWLKTRESQYDMAIIELFDEPGLVTKHLGYAYLVGMNPGWPIVLSGYPGTSYNLPDVRYQYKAEGHVTLTEPFLFSDDLTLFHGDSGAPLWPDPWQTQTNGHHLVVGIHHGRLNNKPVEVRVSPSKKAQIDRWIQ